MKFKNKKIIKLATLIGSTLLLTTGVAATLSSCVITWNDPSMVGPSSGSTGVLNRKYEINWKKVKNGQQKVEIDEKSGLVFRSPARDEVVALAPWSKKADIILPKTVKKVSSYVEVSRVNGETIRTPKGAFEGATNLKSIVFNKKINEISPNIFKNATNLTTVTFNEFITSIPESSFEGTTNLTSINLDRITNIGNNAFKGSFANQEAKATLTISLPAITNIGNSAFENTSNLTTVSFGNNSIIMGNSAFKGSGITSLSLNNSTITSIPESAFENASKLASINLPSSTTIIKSNAFKGTKLTSIQSSNFNGVNTIETGAFSNISTLSSITFPSSLSSLGNSVFSGSSSLSSINLSSTTITSLTNGALSNLPSVTSITLPTRLQTIGANAFQGNSKLATITGLNGNSLTSIGANAFNGCTALTSISLGSGITTLGEGFLNGSKVSNLNLSSATRLNNITGAFKNNSTLTSVTLPTSLRSISNSAFEGASGLNSVNFRNLNQLTSIGSNAFKGTKLTMFNLGSSNSLTTIGDGAFSNISVLNNITLPNNITSIGANAFTGTKLQTIDLSAKTKLRTIGASAFANLTSVTQLKLPTTGLTTIGESAFRGVGSNNGNSLSITLPSTLQTIGNSAFLNAKVTTNFNTATGLTSIGNSAFEGTKVNQVNLNSSSRLTSIGNRAFIGVQSGASNISTITLPSSLQTIGNEAFRFATAANVNLSSLNSLRTIGQGAFENAKITQLDKNKLSSLTTIGQGAFKNNIALTSVSLPNSLTTLGANAFQNASNASLTSIDIQDTRLTRLENQTFGNTNINTVTLPKTLTALGNNIFGTTSKVKTVTWEPTTATSLPSNFYSTGNFGTITSLTLKGKINTLPNNNVPSSLTSVNLANAQITSLPANAFKGTGLTSITLPTTGLTSIGNSAFENASSLTSVDLSNATSLTSVGSNAFKNSGLTSLDLSSSKITSVPVGLVENATSLISVNLPTNITSIGSNAFKSATKLETLKQTTAQPYTPKAVDGLDLSSYSSLTSIGSNAFENTKFTKIDNNKLPSSLTTLGSATFKGMTALASANLSNLSNLTSIPSDLFSGSTSLSSVTLPSSITSIGSNAFNNTAVTSFNNLSGLTTLSPNAFANITNLSTLDLSAASKLTSLPAEFMANSSGNGAGSPYLSRNLRVNPVTLTLPTSITSIDRTAFKNAKIANLDLSSLTLDSDTFNLDFSGANLLATLKFPSNITTFNTNVVDGASVLTTLTLPGSATNWVNQYSSEEPTARTNLSTVEFNVPAIKADSSRAIIGFESIDWQVVADIVSMFTEDGQEEWGKPWQSKTYNSQTLLLAWEVTTLLKAKQQLTDSVSNATKNLNNVSWSYQKQSSSSTDNPYATLTASSSISYFKGADGNAYHFGKQSNGSSSSSKTITIKINLFAN